MFDVFHGRATTPNSMNPPSALRSRADGSRIDTQSNLAGVSPASRAKIVSGCLRVAAFRSYAARMSTERWQAALAAAVAAPSSCLMCSETLWWRCHRRLIAELLQARGARVIHLLEPGKDQEHKPMREAAAREGRLFLCGTLVA
jgi:uncharacterized protein (DUF488 family)